MPTYRVAPYVKGHPGFVFRFEYTHYDRIRGRDMYRVTVRHARRVVFQAMHYSPAPLSGRDTPRAMARDVWDFACHYAESTDTDDPPTWDVLDTETILKHADAVSCALGGE